MFAHSKMSNEDFNTEPVPWTVLPIGTDQKTLLIQRQNKSWCDSKIILPQFFLIFCICSWPSPLCDPQWNCHVHVTTTCSRGSAYHRDDLFSYGCVRCTDKYWWWEPDARFRMTSLCCLREAQKACNCTILSLSLSILSVCFSSVFPVLLSLTVSLHLISSVTHSTFTPLFTPLTFFYLFSLLTKPQTPFLVLEVGYEVLSLSTNSPYFKSFYARGQNPLHPTPQNLLFFVNHPSLPAPLLSFTPVLLSIT